MDGGEGRVGGREEGGAREMVGRRRSRLGRDWEMGGGDGEMVGRSGEMVEGVGGEETVSMVSTIVMYWWAKKSEPRTEHYAFRIYYLSMITSTVFPLE